jgi:thiol-disulfide isomerase/thioredoxin
LLERVGQPFELSFNDAITGAPISVQALKGKIVVINFWASWCRPCLDELPKKKALYEKVHGHGVEFIGVSLDLPEKKHGLERLKKCVAANQIPWPQYYQGNGWESAFSKGLGIDSIPHTLIVDANGNLAVTETQVDPFVRSYGARGELEKRIADVFLKDRKTAPAQ